MPDIELMQHLCKTHLRLICQEGDVSIAENTDVEDSRAFPEQADGRNIVRQHE